MSVGEFWPEKGVQSCEWVLNYRQNLPISNAGNSVSIDHGEPYWTAEVSVEVPKRSPLVKAWSSFFARRHGSRNSFTMNRTFQSFPGNGTPPLATPLTLTIARRFDSRIGSGGGTHGNYRPSLGDMLGYFTEAGGFYVGEVEAIISSNGNQFQVTVSPPPFPFHPTDANFRFTKAVGEFRLDEPPRITEDYSNRSWSFRATQVIRG